MIKVNLSNAENVLSDSHLYQWDLNQTLEIRGLNVATAPQIHFSVRGIKAALVTQSVISDNVITVKIPNLILQYGKDVNAYVYIAENDAKSTVKTIIIPVVSRAKPADYVYDEDVPESVKEKLDAEIARSTQADANHDNRLNAIEAELSGGSGVGRVDATEGASNHGEIFNLYDGVFKNKATGQYSHAEGVKTTASGSYSHAEGYQTTASEYYAHAEGAQTTASKECTHAEGEGTKASSRCQHVQGKFNVEDAAGTYAMIIGNGTADDARSNALTVDWNGNVECGTINGIDVTQLSSGGSGVGQVDTTEGASHHGEIFNNYENGYYFKNKATGLYSHAEGSDTTASGDFSHAEGYTAKATGDFSHAEGSGSTASGSKSHAEGDATNAKGDGSHAEGSGTTASNIAAHAEGGYTTASGSYSHAEGYQARASGDHSHTEGSGTKASSANQHVQGKYNVEDAAGTYAMIIGNGESNTARSNAFTVDWNGNIQCGKTDTDGNFTTYGTINGVDVTQISSGGGVGQTADGAVVNGEIFNDYTLNKATANYAHAEGSNTTASGTSSHAEGSGTTASGHQSHAEGQSCVASGNYSHAEGQSCVASGTHSHAEGCYTKASSNYQHVSGMFNVEDTAKKYAMIIGNGTEPSVLSNALTVDWNGNIQCGKTDTSGNFTTHGTINGVDVNDLLARIIAIESQLSP